MLRKFYFVISKLPHYIAKVNCTWGPFGEWGVCTKSCGGGFQTRLRDIEQQGQNGGLECTGDSTDLKVCNEHACPGRFKICALCLRVKIIRIILIYYVL